MNKKYFSPQYLAILAPCIVRPVRALGWFQYLKSIRAGFYSMEACCGVWASEILKGAYRLSKKLVNSRNRAFKKQSGKCYYCGGKMWQQKEENFAHENSITHKEA